MRPSKVNTGGNVNERAVCTPGTSVHTIPALQQAGCQARDVVPQQLILSSWQGGPEIPHFCAHM